MVFLMATGWTVELEHRLDGWWEGMSDNGLMGKKLIHRWSANMWVHERDLMWEMSIEESLE